MKISSDSDFRPPNANSHLRSLSFAIMGLCLASVSHVALAKGAVTDVTTSTEKATPLVYELNGDTYRFGQGDNQIIETFTYNGESYDFRRLGNRVLIQRDDIPGVAEGSPCGLFAANAAGAFSYAPDYPAIDSGTGNCDMAEMMGGRVVNRGALDVFSNHGATAKNIERIDFVFTHGIVAPLSDAALEKAGHIATEKKGNNPVQIAAITEWDENGKPSAYGPLVFINPVGCGGDDICYGTTQVMNTNGFLHTTSLPPQGYVSRVVTGEVEPLTIAFISLKDLGIQPGQRYFGFSYFGRDVDPTVHNLLDPSSFPNNTADNTNGDGADVYGGTSGFFINAEINDIQGSAFDDANGNGVKDNNETGLPAISVNLYADTNGNGIYDAGVDLPVGDNAQTNDFGLYDFVGVDNGVYFVEVDINDADIPVGVAFSGGENPIKLTVADGDTAGVDFAFYAADTSTDPGTDPDPVDNGGVSPGGADTGIPRTGLQGNGAGSFGGAGLAGLFAVGAWRRRARNAAALALAAPVALTTQALAEPSPSERNFDQRIYIGAGVSASQLEPDPVNSANALTDDSSSGGVFHLGYDLSKRLSVEGYFTDLGNAQMTIGGSAPQDVGYQMYGVSAIGYLWNARNASDYTDGWDDEGYYRREGLSFIGRIGLGGMENDADFQYEQEHKADLHFGAGVEYGFSNGFALRAEAVSYDEDAKAVHLSLLKRFGKANPYIIAKPEPIPVPAPAAPEPEVKPVMLSLPSALFAFDSAMLRAKAEPELQAFAQQLQQAPDINVLIEGHTCSIGSDEYNLGLSQRRADSVRSYLLGQGVAADRMQTMGLGESQPVADNSTPAGREQNRRVDIVKQP